MGREIRKVPPNWQHPKPSNERGERYQPMYARTFAEAAAEWKAEFAEWESGARPGYCSDENKTLEFWEWSGMPPDRDYYSPFTETEATWFQLFETVSEGTPVSPPFATREELAAYLAENGDDWDQKRCWEPHSCQLFGLTYGTPGWGIERATRFCMGSGWAPSMVVENGNVMSGIEFVTKDVP